MKIKIYPKNKKHFIELLHFSKEILDLYKKIKIIPIAYGGLVFFAYVKDKKIIVNDLDFLVPESSFKKIIKVLKKKKIKYNYLPKWHIIQIFNGNLKVEMDSIEYWQKDLPRSFKNIDFNGFIIKAVNLNSLRNIYKKASQVSKDNPQGNNRKYKMLKKIK